MPGASSVDRFRRTLLLAAPALLLGACAPAPSGRLDDLARTLTERLVAEDEKAFLAAFAPSPGSQALGQGTREIVETSARCRRARAEQ